jgi:hypothetical protein
MGEDKSFKLRDISLLRGAGVVFPLNGLTDLVEEFLW